MNVQDLLLERAPVQITEEVTSHSRSHHNLVVRGELHRDFSDDDGRFFLAMAEGEGIFVAAYLLALARGRERAWHSES